MAVRSGDAPIEVVCGIDVGTTSAKAVLVDSDGVVVGEAASDAIATDTSARGSSEQAPEEIWSAVAQAVRRSVDAASVRAEVRALAMGAQSGSVVPVTADGASRPALTWMDSRSADLVGSWSESTRTDIRVTSGWSVGPGLGLSTISWLRSAGLADDVVRWASVDDYLVHEMTGSWLTNPSNACGMQLVDAATSSWSPTLCQLAGVDSDQLSIIAGSGSVAGTLTGTAATMLALPAGIPVVVGGHDQACAALGLGAVEAGDAVMAAGTAWVLTAVTDRVPAAVPEPFSTAPHVVEGMLTVSRNLGGLGAIIAWVLEPFGASEPEARDTDGDSSSAHACYFIPALDDAARTEWGTFAGEPRDPGDRVRAVFEMCGLETRRALEELASTVEITGELTFVGGASQGTALTRTVADVTGHDLAVYPHTSWPAIGAAALAAQAIGWPPISKTERPIEMIRHDPNAVEASRARFDTYQDLIQGVP